MGDVGGSLVGLVLSLLGLRLGFGFGQFAFGVFAGRLEISTDPFPCTEIQ